MKETVDIWKDIFLKNVVIENVQINNNNMVLEVSKNNKNSQKNVYQVFEILICTTLCKFYPDFNWHLTPISRDKGIDVWALKDDRPLPFQAKNKPIVIYGQIKRNASYVSEQKIIEATNKIIRTHTDSFLQKRNVYKIIHLISSDKNFKKEIKVTPGLVNSLSYIVEIINTEDIFTIWAINKRYFLASLPVKISLKEKEQISLFLEKRNKDISEIIQYRLEPPDSIPIGAAVRFKLTISNLLQVPFSIDIGIHISDNNIYLIAPQNILKNKEHGTKITLYKEYTLELYIKIVGLIKNPCTYITLNAFNSNKPIRINIPIKNVTSRFDPVIYMAPIAVPYNTLCSVLSEENKKIAFYSIVGEGGIGKSSLINEISIWAINHDYSVYKIEHPCQETPEYVIITSIIEKLLFDNDSRVHIHSELNSDLKGTLAYYFNPLWNNTMETFFKEGKIVNSEHFYECLITLFICVLDRHSILLNLSNLHWSNAQLVTFFSKLVRNLQSNQNYFSHKLVIIFEGRIFEAVKDNYSLRIADEWMNFYDRNPVIPIKIEKWSDECSQKYIETLFTDKALDPLTLKSRDCIINFIYNNCKGNPMHIKEAIIALENNKSIKPIACNLYIPLRNNYDQICIPTLIDTIKLRIAYYAEQWSFLVDMLVVLSCIEKGAYVYAYVDNQYYSKGIDWKNVLRDSGFINLISDNIYFLHENYKSAFNELKVLCDKNIDNFLLWCDSREFKISFSEKVVLELHKREVNYLNLYNKIINELDAPLEQRERYQLLELINSIYDYLPTNDIIPRYHIYKQLETVTKEMGSWKKALEYNRKLKAENLDTIDYMIVCSHGRRNLANIYSFSMQWDEAVNEAKEAIKQLEVFIGNKDLKAEDFFELQRQLSLLYNRLSIVYQFSGNHTNAQTNDKIAYRISKKNNDLYAMYHIQYERGIWKLNENPINGYKLIKEAKEFLQNKNFVSQQEKDLVSTYEKMGWLKKASKRKRNSRTFWEKEFDECRDLSRRSSMKDESLEPIVCNLLCGIVNIFLNDYLEAIEYFERSLTIAGRASMEQCLWMCYLNVAQTYAILAESDSEWKDIYMDKRIFYAQEADKLIADSMELNQNSKHLHKAYSYPQKIINYLKNINATPVEVLSNDDKFYSPVYIEFRNFAFFLL